MSEKKANLRDVLLIITLCTIMCLGYLRLGWVLRGAHFDDRQVSDSVSIAVAAPILENGNFEGGFYLQDGIGELQVPNGWKAWFIEGGSPNRHRPEYKAETRLIGSGRVRSGLRSAKQFTTFSPHEGGLVWCGDGFIKDQWYVVSGWVYVWSSAEDDPDVSIKGGKYMTAIGVNAWGEDPRTYQNKNQMVWSKGTFQTDEWVYHELEFKAWGGRACIYTLGQPEYGAKHNDSYWDDMELRLADHGSTQPTATPRPTYTVYPTNTPQPTYTPLPTHTPAPACTPGPISDNLSCYGLIDGNTGDLYRRCEYGNDVWYRDEEGVYVCPK